MPGIPDGLIIFIAFLFGSIIGSFLNVVSLRLRTGMGVGGRSMCMSCGRTLSWSELIPVASFLFQSGRCRGCSAKISWQYPLVEAATGILFALTLSKLLGLGLTLPHVMAALIYAVSICILVVITVYDFRHKIIPDGLVYSFDAIALLSAFIGGFGSSPALLHPAHAWTLLAGPVLAAPFALLWLISGGKWLGLGDAKLVLGIGWLLGMNGGANALVMAFWIGAVVSVLWLLASKGKIERGTEIPFGPFLVIGALIVLFSGFRVIDLSLLTSLL